MTATEPPASPPARTYLSIGEALDALKPEFPDITISKIRFFEGQGLVEPERTPSGYRKFTMVEVERLRWVLRQQQEAYLPLKVIRERLASAEELGQVPRQTPRSTEPRVIADPRKAFAEEALGALDVLNSGREQAGSELSGLGSGLDEDDLDDDDLDDAFDDAEEAAFDPTRHLASGRAEGAVGTGEPGEETMGEFRHPAARARSATLRPEPVRPPAQVASKAPAASSPSRVLASQVSASQASQASQGGAPHQGGAAQPSHAPTDRAGQARSGASNTGTGSDATGAADSSSRLGSRNPMLGPASGAALSFSELAATSGLSLDDLRLIEEFGLITGRQMFDGRFYDDDALQVAKTVVAFRAFGVEPRHLRMYKSAADRESAFFAQVLSPMLHRRTPDARAKAADTMGELHRLGEQLRDATLRQALRDVLDGRA